MFHLRTKFSCRYDHIYMVTILRSGPLNYVTEQVHPAPRWENVRTVQVLWLGGAAIDEPGSG
jgi:hypothetical protein